MQFVLGIHSRFRYKSVMHFAIAVPTFILPSSNITFTNIDRGTCVVFPCFDRFPRAYTLSQLHVDEKFNRFYALKEGALWRKYANTKKLRFMPTYSCHFDFNSFA